MRILLSLLIFILITHYSGQNLFSQRIATPLEPQAPPKQTELGIVFGLGNNFQSGTYQPNCVECQFEAAQGFGITVGTVFIKDFIPELQWGATLVFNTKNAKTSYQKTEMVEIWTDPPSKFEERPIPFRNTAEFQIGEIELIPFLQWMPLEFMYLRLGVGASLLTDYGFKQSKELLKFKDTLSTGEIVDLVIDGDNPKIKIVENNKIPETNPLQFSIEPSFGFVFEVSNQIYLNPSFSYSIPLSAFSNRQVDFNLNKWRILVELRLALKLRNININ